MNNGEQFFDTAAGGYSIERSLRFNSNDSAYLSRTPASAGNRKTWTWAGWVKRSTLSSRQNFFGTGDASFNYSFWVEFFNDDTLRFGDYTTTHTCLFQTSQVFRDTASWGHIVLAVDTTQSTSANRVKAYWNGVQITAFSTATYPSQNLDTQLNTTTAHGIGRAGSYAAQYLNGYLADIHFIDGQALDPTSFGEFSATTGVWVPKAYSGPAATGNSFWLPFSDNSAATATTLGKDNFNLGNNWSPSNLSVTAGAGNDSLVDVPTNGSEVDAGLGGQVRGNYATLNPLALGGSLANGNLDFTSSGSGGSTSTIGVSSGKWYWEVYIGSTPTNTYVGLYDNPNNLLTGNVIIGTGGNRFTDAGGTFTVTSATFQVGDIFGVAADIDAGNVTWYRNGSVAITLAGATLNTKPWFPGTNVNAAAASPIIYNFGQRPFAYTAPSGFKALCTANLPTPTIAQPSTVFDAITYSGTGGTTSLTTSFSPDMVWIKSRSINYWHRMFDQIRGAQQEIYTNVTQAEVTATGGSNSFTSTGFNAASDYTNTNGQTFIAWMWDAGSSTVTNTAGTISSQVRANASAGFSVVTYTAVVAANQTVGHGLGVAPSMIICKSRSTTSGWPVYHKSLGTSSDYLVLNLTDPKGTSTNYWGSSHPTSTVFGVDANGFANNSGNMVAYCFAPVAGYSSFGSYTGNGSADGPFVYTGFRPRWIMVKRTSSDVSGGNWIIKDALRDGYNDNQKELYPNLFNAEATSYSFDILSNGFKVRSNNVDINGSTYGYIYAAFAESPFQYARAR